MRIISLGIFIVTIFVSAFLLFQVQPMLARFVLPWFGGTPTVWTICMLFFQVFLFLGYAYAHALRRWASIPWQAGIHTVLLCVALTFLPIMPDPSWRGLDNLAPTITILLLLSSTVGVPYFLLSSTGPLLQVWFAHSHVDRSPYPLYAVSNGGSFLALLSYPFVIEPLFPVSQQVSIWSGFYVTFALMCAAIGVYVAFFQKRETVEVSGSAVVVPDITWTTRVVWVMLPAAASLILLSMTTHITQDIAAVPLLWVIPLSLYLLSFILCFESDRWYNSKKYGFALTVAIFASLLQVLVLKNSYPLFGVGLYCGFLFISCMICHGELVKLRPDPDRLTSFYLSVAAGGALGGIFVGVFAPLIFETYVEVQICFVIFLLLILFADSENPESLLKEKKGTLRHAISGACFLVVAVTLFSVFAKSDPGAQASRNFYGVLTKSEVDVGDGTKMRRLAHGRILHGLQYLSDDRLDEPTSYYSRQTGVGHLLKIDLPELATRKIGVVGLGVGTLAAYGKETDDFRFYEINPDVTEYAENDFSFLSRSKAQTEVVPGDALISMENEAPQNYDILVLDAFSGDAIPVHLLTREAFSVYLKHIAEGGAIAIHISNKYFDLRPVLWALSDELGFKSVYFASPYDLSENVGSVKWIVMTKSDRLIDALEQDPYTVPRDQGIQPVLWTDDYSNVFGVLKLKS